MFKRQNDPLLDAAKAAVVKGDEHRKAVSTVNEHFGVYGRRALPLAQKAEYDLALKKVMAGEKLVVSEEHERGKEVVKDKDSFKQTLKNGKLIQRKKFKDPIEEEEVLNEISKKTLGSYIKKATDDVASQAARTELAHKQGNDAASLKAFQKRQSRGRGIDQAVDRLVGQKKLKKIDPTPHLSRLKKFEKNESWNYHAENRVMLAQHYGSAEEHDDAKSLYQKHMKLGHLPMDDHYQRVHDANNKKGGHFDKMVTAAKAEWDAMKVKPKSKPYYMKEEFLNELSKKKLGDYVIKAADVDKLAKTDKPEKLESRLNSIDKAVKKMKAKPNERLNEKVLTNKLDDYSPSYEKADEKKARAKRLLNKAKDKKQLDEASKAKLQNYVQKAIASQLELTTKRKAVGKDDELEKDIRKRGRGINNAKDKLEGPRGPNRSWQTAPSGKMKATKVFAKEENVEEAYSKTAVDKEIKKDKRISGKEAARIHALLKGRQKSDEPLKEDIKTIKEEIAKNLYEKYQAVNEDEKQAWVDALDEDAFYILKEFLDNMPSGRDQLHSALNGLKSIYNRVTGAAKDVYNNTPSGADQLRSAASIVRGKPAPAPLAAPTGIASFRPKPTAVATAMAANAVERAQGKVHDPVDDHAPASVAPVAAATAAAEKPAAPANKVIANPNLKDVWDNYTPEERSKRQGMTGLPAVEFDKEVANRLKTTGVPATPAAAAAPTATADAPASDAPDAPAAPAPAASTAAADDETKTYSKPSPSSSRSAPMAPKRSGTWGFGAGSGSDSAGAITNRALGAVNEEVHTPRSGLDGWINKYKAPKKKK